MCSGMIQAAFQRTEKIEWNREFGAWSVKWTVWSSTASTFSTWVENAPLQTIPGVSIWVWTVKTTSSAVNCSPSLHKIPSRRFTVISEKSSLYSGGPLASELWVTPSIPASGSMNQSVSISN